MQPFIVDIVDGTEHDQQANVHPIVVNSIHFVWLEVGYVNTVDGSHPAPLGMYKTVQTIR